MSHRRGRPWRTWWAGPAQGGGAVGGAARAGVTARAPPPRPPRRLLPRLPPRPAPARAPAPAPLPALRSAREAPQQPRYLQGNVYNLDTSINMVHEYQSILHGTILPNQKNSLHHNSLF